MAQYKRKLAKGERWFYKFDLNGKTHRSQAIYLSKQEAKKAEAKAYEKADEDLRSPKLDLTVLEALNERLDYIKQRKSEKYYLENKRYFSMFVQKFGEWPFSDITRQDFNRFISEFATDLEKRKKTKHKANACIRCLKAAFNYIIKLYDLNLRNPCHVHFSQSTAT